MLRQSVGRARGRVGAAGLTLLVATSAAPLHAQTPAAAAATVDIPTIKYERFVLPNGLVAILSENHSSPIVTVDIWYHVGSKNELPGRTGFAHLFEHMMFEGSENIKSGEHRTIVQSAGGSMNGTTSEDRTNYYETMPSNQLETVLWMESDRMATLLTRIDQARLDAEREIVKNERRLRVDNVPFGVANIITPAQLYPADYPYSWPGIGSMADLSAATLDDVKNFFRMYYVPNNATMVITGDFKPADAKTLIQKYFGPIPRGKAITRPTLKAVTLPGEKRLVLEDSRARLPQLRFAWPTVGNGHADLMSLQALGRVLAFDRTSRLTKLLVYDRQLATGVSAENFDFESPNAGIFQIEVAPRPTASLTEIERLVDSVVASMKSAPVSAKEVQKAKNSRSVRAVTDLQFSLLRAEALAQGEVFDKNPTSFVTMLKDFAKVTPADVQRVTKQYITDGRMVMSMVPAGKLDQISKPDKPYTNVTPPRVAGASGGSK